MTDLLLYIIIVNIEYIEYEKISECRLPVSDVTRWTK